uniref:Protein-serine/threonine kinase n=1 Tax=Timema bartmani TaxID=61472 RepID=A0A7R9F4K1_9NEOP|nr:unnamed protein product [Timema bartmani]
MLRPSIFIISSSLTPASLGGWPPFPTEPPRPARMARLVSSKLTRWHWYRGMYQNNPQILTSCNKLINLVPVKNYSRGCTCPSDFARGASAAQEPGASVATMAALGHRAAYAGSQQRGEVAVVDVVPVHNGTKLDRLCWTCGREGRQLTKGYSEVLYILVYQVTVTCEDSNQTVPGGRVFEPRPMRLYMKVKEQTVFVRIETSWYQIGAHNHISNNAGPTIISPTMQAPNIGFRRSNQCVRLDCQILPLPLSYPSVLRVCSSLRLIAGFDTDMRRYYVPPEERLSMTLRYLDTGCTFSELHFTFIIALLVNAAANCEDRVNQSVPDHKSTRIYCLFCLYSLMLHLLFIGLSACERKSFVFLRKELPVRLANIMKEIHLLPENLLRMPSVGLVNNWYMRSFDEILEFEKIEVTNKNLERFCESLVKIRNRHTDVIPTMAQGILELKESHEVNQQTENSIQYFLDRFYMSRISIRMLINQHTLLFGKKPVSNNSRHIGSIDPQCDVMDVVQDAYENARFLCDQYYLSSPELIVKQNIPEDDSKIRIVYVPSHLYHILFELFKNSMRAVMEANSVSEQYPPIEVTLVKGREDICVKISDRGGGIPRSQTDQLFNYMFSTAPQPPKSDAHTVPLAVSQPEEQLFQKSGKSIKYMGFISVDFDEINQQWIRFLLFGTYLKIVGRQYIHFKKRRIMAVLKQCAALGTKIY